MHVTLRQRQGGPEERVARDVVGEHVGRLTAAAHDPSVLGPRAVDEGGQDDALGIEAGEVEERAVDAVQRAAPADDLGVAVAAREVEVPEGRVVGGDQDGRTRLGDAVA
jgi:hypothetical protein